MGHTHRRSRRRLRGTLALLRGLRSVAEDGVRAGTSDGAGAYTVRQYNRVLHMLRHDSPDLDLRLFEPIDENLGRDQGLTQVGISCALLIQYLKNEIGSEPDDDWDDDDRGGDGDEDGGEGDGEDGDSEDEDEEYDWDEDGGEEGDDAEEEDGD